MDPAAESNTVNFEGAGEGGLGFGSGSGYLGSRSGPRSGLGPRSASGSASGSGLGFGMTGGGVGDLSANGRDERGGQGGSVVGVAEAVAVKEETSGGLEGGWIASVKSHRTPQSPQSEPIWQPLYCEPCPPSSQ